MYVIWRKRKRARYAGWGNVGDVRLTPIIVESRRVGGKPTQVHIACLRSIIDTSINEKNAVWFWDDVEEKLARLGNRVPPEEMEKIRAALAKVVPIPDPRFAEDLRAGAQAYIDETARILNPGLESTRKQNRARLSFSNSRKTAEACADCGEKLETVYRERRTFGRGFIGGWRWTTGVLCENCAEPSWHYRRGSCETCGREVFVSRSIPMSRTFCSIRCGQAYYRAARKSQVAKTGSDHELKEVGLHDTAEELQ